MLTSNRFESLIAHESLCKSLFDFIKNFCSSVTETVLNKDDIPWEVLKRRGFESVRLMVSIPIFYKNCFVYNLSIGTTHLCCYSIEDLSFSPYRHSSMKSPALMP
jgi:hypothetical protein